MDQATWTVVDEYLNGKLVGSDDSLEAALLANAKAQLPAFDVAPNQEKLLHLLVRMCGGRRVLEIGTLGGYSTIWFAKAVPDDGIVITLESEAKHAEIAALNLEKAGVASKVDIRVGPALTTLQQLVSEGCPPFDFIFIDADKPNNPGYLEWSLKLSRPGTVIVGDNVIRNGAVVDPENQDARVQGVRRFFDDISTDRRLTATALQTVGSKGYDGFALALVEELPAKRHPLQHFVSDSR